MIDLERALFDLSEHLDVPGADDLAIVVRQRIAEPDVVDRAGRPRARLLVAIAAVFVLIVGAVLTIPPARHAIADWLGIGAVEVRSSTGPLPTGVSSRTVPGAPDPARNHAAAVATKLAAARAAVSFEVATANDTTAGELLGVDIDRRVPGGLVVLRYAGFTLVELGSQPGSPPFAKYADQTVVVESTTVRGQPGLWINGAHDITFLDRTGNVRRDTVRRSGPVLMWARNGITYRIEGIAQSAAAHRIADAIA